MGGWVFESTNFHRPNEVSCQLVARDKLRPLIRSYIQISTLDHLPDLEDAPKRFMGRDHFVLGDLNANIGCLSNP